MPIYNPTIQTLEMSELKRYSGLTKCTEFPQHLLDHACTEAQIISKPKASWQMYDYDASSATIMSPEPLSLPPTVISKHLANSLKVAVIAVTIGPDLEELVSDYFSKNEYTLGLLLDAAGTTAVELAADQACELIKQEANKQGYTTLFRFSPGYGQWDIRVQPQILSLAHGDEINITVTSTCMLLPRKSITAVIGLTATVPNLPLKEMIEGSKCDQCQQINCLSRKD
ncbi:methionine synthase [Pelosinus baikalensis]|uniref:Methionine synthase n=1 Tax=Pelosinus baikalensis TaxID=2892015 RepID=A0ABS8HWA8_9FIRM|nr:methionine synthase [Pelosinus baikalensis]